MMWRSSTTGVGDARVVVRRTVKRVKATVLYMALLFSESDDVVGPDLASMEPSDLSQGSCVYNGDV